MGDIAAPRFVQPPAMHASSAGLSVSFAVDKPARLDWAIAYDTVSADFRDVLLGFKSSLLSTPQVLKASQLTQTSTSTALRRLHTESVVDVGPVIASGQSSIDTVQSPQSFQLMAPCLSQSGMCQLHADALNPYTNYKVRSLSMLLCLTVPRLHMTHVSIRQVQSSTLVDIGHIHVCTRLTQTVISRSGVPGPDGCQRESNEDSRRCVEYNSTRCKRTRDIFNHAV
jgi:hypothetical protein